MQSNHMEVPSMCTRCWTIFFAFKFGSYMLWITFANDILVEVSTKYYASQSSPHITFANLRTKYVSNLKVVWCCVAMQFIEGNFQFLIQCKQKKILRPPTNALSLHWWHLAPWQTHTMMASPLASPWFHPNKKHLCT